MRIDPEWIMIALTGGYVYVTAKAFSILKKQAHHMSDGIDLSQEQLDITREAAIAAKQSADAIINAERAWVMVDIEWADRKTRVMEQVNVDSAGQRKEGVCAEIMLVCKNDGKTPGWITEKRAKMQLIDVLPGNPEFENVGAGEFYEIGTEPLKVGGQCESKILLSCPGRLEGLKMLVIYGFVKYRDAFRPKINNFGWPDLYTGFGFVIGPDFTLKRITMFEEYEQYNRYT